MTIQDWGITYAELEPYYDKFEYTAAVSGKAGNIGGQILSGGNPFEASRARDYPLPPLTPILASEMFSDAARNAATIRSRGRRRMPRSPIPTRTVRNSAAASIAAIASASAARPTPRAVRT